MITFIIQVINIMDVVIRTFMLKFLVHSANIVLMGTSAQTNLGDHAISIATKRFIRTSFKKSKLIEISKEVFYAERDFWKNNIDKDAIIVITGGGFLGDLWMTEETLVRDIISDYHTHKIIIFPQTIYFSRNSKEFKNTVNSYKMARNLIINVREENSYNFFKQNIPEVTNVFCIPDMVLSWKFDSKHSGNKTALVCIREDIENCLSEKEKEEIISKLKYHFYVKNITTISRWAVPICLREVVVNNMLRLFRKADIIVTNRLHAMIFAAITHTPCIAIDNISHKISGVYKWISDLGYIRIVEDISELDNTIEELMFGNNVEAHDKKLDKQFEILKKEFEM